MAKNNHGRTLYDGVEWEKDRQNKMHEEEELRRCGVKTYRRKRQTPEWDKVTVIPVGEIEVSDELDQFVKKEILDGWRYLNGLEDATYRGWPRFLTTLQSLVRLY